MEDEEISFDIDNGVLKKYLGDICTILPGLSKTTGKSAASALAAFASEHLSKLIKDNIRDASNGVRGSVPVFFFHILVL